MTGTDVIELQERQASLVWGVAQIAAGGEKPATNDLKELGFKVFVPKIRTLEVIRRNQRRKYLKEPVERPLFKGYLFFGWDPCRPKWPEARQANCVRAIIRQVRSDDAALVPRSVMDALMANDGVLDLTGAAARPFPEFAVGETVEFTRGVGQGFLWRVTRVDPTMRIALFLRMLRQGVEHGFVVRASAADLKKTAA